MLRPMAVTATTPPVDPCLLVIFGATGDLARRKLVPALANLRAAALLPDGFEVLGLGGRKLDDEGLRNHLEEGLPKSVRPEAWDWLRAKISYLAGDFKDEATYNRLRERLCPSEADGPRNIMFYLSTPPSFFAVIAENLARLALTQEPPDGYRRLVVEKPFGHDLASAVTLNRKLLCRLDERQIFRIDHYLGKETVQNLLVFRFANGIFEPIWNRRYIDHVQITVAETVGVGHRGRYYEEAGALRDMVPNHLFQLLALTAMEPPTSFAADAVRNEKGKVLDALRPLTPEEVLTQAVRGQYGPGQDPGGNLQKGYREESFIDPGSPTETFVALKLYLDNWRFAGVPFYLRTGKRMPRRMTEVVIQFRQVPFVLFKRARAAPTPNQLVLRIQPEEGIHLSFAAKVPGPAMKMGPVEMDFSYQEAFGSKPTTGYETLLYDAMRGDATLFQRADNLERAWGFVQPILDVWKALPPRDFPDYKAGSLGPSDVAALLEDDGRSWRNG